MHRNETRLYGEGAYRGNNERRRLSELAPNARDFTNKHVHQRRPLIDADRATNQRKSAVRSKVEHPLLTLKRLWGIAKLRYRDPAKNVNRASAILATLTLVK